MKWWNRLSVRLTVFIILLAIVPLASFGIATIKDIVRIRLQSIAAFQKEVAGNSAKLIQASLSDIAKEIELVAESTELQSSDPGDQEWVLQMLLKASSHLNSLTIVDLDGRNLVKVGRSSVHLHNDLETEAKPIELPKGLDQEPVLGKLYAAESNLLSLDMYIPLLSPMDRQVAKVLVAEINMAKLLDFITGLHVGKTGYIYVVNDAGKYLVYPDHSAVLAGEDALYNPLVRDFVAGRKQLSANVRYLNRYQNEVMSNAFEIAQPRMLVVAAQPVSEAMATVTQINRRQVWVLSIVFGIAILSSLYFFVKMVGPLRRLERGAQLIGEGDLSHRIKVNSSDELGLATASFNDMAEELEARSRQAERQSWLNRGVAELENLLRGDQSLQDVCSHIVTFMATYLQQQVGLIYTHDGKGTYHYQTGYAFQPGGLFSSVFKLGEGLVGQAALTQKMLEITDIPADYVTITSGLGKTAPKHLTLVPFVFNDQVEAVMELGSLAELSELQQMFLQETADSLAIILASTRTREALNQALLQTRQQAKELQRQQEELQASNEEMEEQTQLLMASESKLKEQQEELQAANEELEEKAEHLERNKRNIELKNQALEELRLQLEKKAEDLTMTSKYKSEFLANMSHELRTPLNSLLLLSKMLVDNKEGNLLAEQVDSAEIIYNSGKDLLALINEILDLSKIEAGKMELNIADIPVFEIQESLLRNFKKVANEKGLSFEVFVGEDCPETIVSDRQRIEQVLKNFIANAFKFTPQGGVTVAIYRPKGSQEFIKPGLTNDNTLVIDVRDTGIGIPADKQSLIFEAFQQLEGGSARKYGGTGLGLSISKELANLLGGEIHLQSEENVGSTFSLILPIEAKPKVSGEPPSLEMYSHGEVTTSSGEPSVATISESKSTADAVADDRHKLGPDDKTVLIIEDDANFAKTLLRFCQGKGFKTLVASSGEDGLKLAAEYQPKAVILDINLPGIDGWTVIEALKDNPATRHIPVHFMSADDPVPAAFAKGAVGYLDKPVSQQDLEKAIASLELVIDKEMKDLLLVEDNVDQRRAITRLISDSDVVIREVANGRDAIAALREKQFDCMIMDLGLPDISGFALLKKIEKDEGISLPPIIVYTGKELTREEENELRKYSESIIIKGVRSEERLLDETSLFLHRMVEKMPAEKRQMISHLHDGDQNLRDRNILIVDDDMRNVFALSKVLNDKGINTLKAENGIRALEILAEREDVHLVLMDIMMPQMDGYETMRRIRAQSRFAQLPIIALTAKAMQKDKDECLAAGANDYLAKPVDINRLLSLMRIWHYR